MLQQCHNVTMTQCHNNVTMSQQCYNNVTAMSECHIMSTKFAPGVKIAVLYIPLSQSHQSHSHQPVWQLSEMVEKVEKVLIETVEAPSQSHQAVW